MLADKFRTYKLAPYRLATVAGGCFVAFIWTIFPSPLTDRTWLRRDISSSLYLLANYFGVITSTVRSQVEGTAGNPDDLNSPAHELQRVRRKIFGKMMLLLPSMAQHADWQKWEPTIGGRFPREAYEDIIMRTTRIMSYLTFMSYTMNHPPTSHLDALRARNDGTSTPVPPEHPASPPYSAAAATAADTDEGATPAAETSRDWLNALAQVLREITPSHHNIVSTLMLLSNALFTGQSLPPFLPLPRPYEMTRALLRLDRRYDTATATARPDSSSTASVSSDEADLSPLMVVDSRTGREVADGARGQHYGAGKGLGLGLGLGREHVLDPENVEKPGYAEFAVLEICSTLVCDDLEGLIRRIGGLVGVVDFSYRVDRAGSWEGSGESVGVGGKGKRD